MNHSYLGLISFSEALAREQSAWESVLNGAGDVVLGFESQPAITLGVRGKDEDIQWPADHLERRGFTVHRLQRGGQATLHHPGQLVIFPIVDVRELGARAWIDLLLQVSARTLLDFGKAAACRAHQPGLYSDLGKVVSVGVRVRRGVSTHGLAINVCNDLTDFESIRPCGVTGAPMDRVGAEHRPEAVFASWIRNFQGALPRGLTSSRNLMNLECSSLDVRL